MSLLWRFADLVLAWLWASEIFVILPFVCAWLRQWLHLLSALSYVIFSAKQKKISNSFVDWQIVYLSLGVFSTKCWLLLGHSLYTIKHILLCDPSPYLPSISWPCSFPKFSFRSILMTISCDMSTCSCSLLVWLLFHSFLLLGIQFTNDSLILFPSCLTHSKNINLQLFHHIF